MKQLLINLPVENVESSKVFFEKIGLTFNKELTDENATCFNIDENIVIALLPSEHFKAAVNNTVLIDATKVNEMLLSIGVNSNEEVDTFFNKAIEAGGKDKGKPTDYGSVYGATFSDLDGHLWNIFHMVK
ncbi:MAG: VOC family protein [Candidatus Dojkabacteria bacterium]